jgi:hypothetical protein
LTEPPPDPLPDDEPPDGAAPPVGLAAVGERDPEPEVEPEPEFDEDAFVVVRVGDAVPAVVDNELLDIGALAEVPPDELEEPELPQATSGRITGRRAENSSRRLTLSA